MSVVTQRTYQEGGSLGGGSYVSVFFPLQVQKQVELSQGELNFPAVEL